MSLALINRPESVSVRRFIPSGSKLDPVAERAELLSSYKNGKKYSSVAFISEIKDGVMQPGEVLTYAELVERDEKTTVADFCNRVLDDMSVNRDAYAAVNDKMYFTLRFLASGLRVM